MKIRFKFGPSTGIPSTSTSPRVGLRKPPTTLSSVDLPHPDGPTMQTKTPSGTVRLIFSNTSIDFSFSPPDGRREFRESEKSNDKSRISIFVCGCDDWGPISILCFQVVPDIQTLFQKLLVASKGERADRKIWDRKIRTHGWKVLIFLSHVFLSFNKCSHHQLSLLTIMSSVK